MFKRKNMWWVNLCVACIACVVCVVLYGFRRTKEPGEDYAQIEQGEALADEGMQQNGLLQDDSFGEAILQTDLGMVSQEEIMRGEQIMEAPMVSELSHEEAEAVLEDKMLSILGDSISTYEGWIPDGYVDFFPMNGEVADVDETWWKLLIDDTGMQFCANSSSAGSTCVGDSLSIDNPKYACSNYRIDDLIGKGGVYPDIIIVYMGTNDLLIGVPIGENDGTQPVEEGVVETFSDAYTLILDKLESQYPGAQIFCCTLAQIGDWGDKKPFINFVNSEGLTSEDYGRQIEVIAGNRGFGVIDLLSCGITVDNMHKYVTDGVHLNTEGMKLVRDAVKEAVMAAVY